MHRVWTAVPFRTSVNRQDCRRASGRIEQAAVEGRDGEHRVGGHRGRVELWVVGQHLLGVGGGTLIARVEPQPDYIASSSAYFAAGFELMERATTYARAGGEGG